MEGREPVHAPIRNDAAEHTDRARQVLTAYRAWLNSGEDVDYATATWHAIELAHTVRCLLAVIDENQR